MTTYDAAPLPLYRFTVAQYHDLIRLGVLHSGDPVELLEGVLVYKMTKSPPHRFATQVLRDLLTDMLPPGWFVDDQEPVTTSDSEPEPDLMIVRGDRRQYLQQDRHPSPDETPIVIEVADSSLPTDRSLKGRLYARSRVREYWIVNLVDRQVEVYTDPTGDADQARYQTRADHPAGGEVPVTLDGIEVGRVRIADLLT